MKVTSTKAVLAQAIVTKVTQQADTNTTEEDQDDYEEDVEALTQVVTGKHPPAAQSVYDLLDATRHKRTTWLQEEISIAEILNKFPCFKNSKWVCVTS